MKKTLYIALFCLFASSGFSQAWVEAFALYSTPLEDFTTDATSRIEVGDYYFNIEDRYLFRTFANPAVGGGASFRYVKNQFIVGLEVSYVEYGERTNLLRLTMFRIGPTFEYFFLPESKFHPYIGAELGLINPKAYYNSEVINRSEISRTYLGGGIRAGFTYSISQDWAIRVGAKYMLLETMPYADFTIGVAYNLGDF